jgi:hypothetical protein
VPLRYLQNWKSTGTVPLQNYNLSFVYRGELCS